MTLFLKVFPLLRINCTIPNVPWWYIFRWKSLIIIWLGIILAHDTVFRHSYSVTNWTYCNVRLIDLYSSMTSYYEFKGWSTCSNITTSSFLKKYTCYSGKGDCLTKMNTIKLLFYIGSSKLHWIKYMYDQWHEYFIKKWNKL